MKLFFLQKTNSLWERLLEPIRSEFPDLEIVTDLKEAHRRVDEADIIVGGKLGREIFERARRLKLVVVPFTGVNHLPLDLFKERGVRVANSHGNAWYVAERTVAMILAYYGKIISYHNDLTKGQWHGFWVGQGLNDTWESVDGKTAAILGTGEIGKYVAAMLKAFRVTSVGFKRQQNKEKLPHFDTIVYDLDEAIDRSDIVVIALPSTPRTQGLFDAQRLSKMQNKLLVNVGRGDIVDEKALYQALREGTLGGAAIDCWYNYPKEGTVGFPSSYPLHELENIVLSPHAAGFTSQAARKGIEQACENIASFLKNGAPRFEVDLEEGY
ncbi:MAG TPA: hydroxyacid dehydrogenase [Sediminispirochaeta sp.]|nr:hydroxyacid dehydrogenase [Sediminispirochaeta sp.]